MSPTVKYNCEPAGELEYLCNIDGLTRVIP